MFHIFFPFFSKVEVLSFLFAFFQFYSVVCRDSLLILLLFIETELLCSFNNSKEECISETIINDRLRVKLEPISPFSIK